MREVVEAAHAKGGAPPDSSFWGIAPDAFGDGAKPPTLRHRRPRLGGAQARRAALPPHADGAEQPDRVDRRGRGAALARRRTVPARAARRRRRSDARASRRNQLMRIETLDVLRCPYCGGRLDAGRVAVPSPHRRRDPRRHPRLPLLHLSGRRRHPGAARAAGVDAWRAITSRPASRISRAARCSGSTTTRRPRRSTPSPPRPPRPIARPSRRSARTSRAATSSIASPIRPTSSRRR